jgi:branched-subunit amino acid transport protein
LRIGARAKRFLDYSTPAVLSAIWGPIVFMPHGQLSWADNAPYVLGAAAALALAWKTKNVLLTTVLGMGVFTVLKMWVFA